VYRRELDELTALPERLQHEATPAAPLRAWVTAVEFVATRKGMATALLLAAHNKSPAACPFKRMSGAVRVTLDPLKSANTSPSQIAPRISCGR